MDYKAFFTDFQHTASIGDNQIITCPIHKGGCESNPSFTVTMGPDGKLLYHCFTCGKGIFHKLKEAGLLPDSNHSTTPYYETPSTPDIWAQPSLSPNVPQVQAQPQPQADSLPEAFAALYAHYGLDVADYQQARCAHDQQQTYFFPGKWRCHAPFITYPTLQLDGTYKNKYKSVVRYDGKRAFATDKGFSLGVFPFTNLSGNGETLVIVAGEEKAMILHKAGIRAISFSNGEGSPPSPDWVSLLIAQGNNDIVICHDADEAGEQGTMAYLQAFEAANKPNNKPVIAVRCVVWESGLPKGYDVNDYAKQHGLQALHSLIADAIPADMFSKEQNDKAREAQREKARAKRGTGPLKSVEEWQAMDIPPETWLVEGLITDGGSTMIAAEPKTGKTLFAMQLASALINGHDFLGMETHFPTDKKILFLEYEMGTQKTIRYTKIACHNTQGRLLVDVKPTFNIAQHGLDPLTSYLDEQPNIALIIVDVYADLMGHKNSSANAYEKDKMLSNPFLKWCDEHNITVVFLHHTNKPTNKTTAKLDASNAFNNISGSNGIRGMNNTNLVLVETGKTSHDKKPHDKKPQKLSLYVEGRADYTQTAWRLLLTSTGQFILDESPETPEAPAHDKKRSEAFDPIPYGGKFPQPTLPTSTTTALNLPLIAQPQSTTRH